jgi:hypothetical protein
VYRVTAKGAVTYCSKDIGFKKRDLERLKVKKPSPYDSILSLNDGQKY